MSTDHTTRRNSDVRAAPHVRALADQLGVTLAALDGHGTGIGGRITPRDVRAAATRLDDSAWFPGTTTPTLAG